MSLSGLRWLSLADNYITELPDVSRLEHLEELHVEDNTLQEVGCSYRA